MSELTIGEAGFTALRVRVVATNGKEVYRDDRIGAYESRAVAMSVTYARALRHLPDAVMIRVTSFPAPGLR